MQHINNVIFIVTEDLEYGKLIHQALSQRKYGHIIHFENVEMCQKSLHKKPSVIISDYHLQKTTGLQLIQKAKNFNQDCFAILISEDGPHGFNSFDDDRFIRYVDKFVIRGMNDMGEIIDALMYGWVVQ